MQDHWFNAIAQFSDMLAAATEIGADHLVFHVFVHKMETLATENKTSALCRSVEKVVDTDYGVNSKIQ